MNKMTKLCINHLVRELVEKRRTVFIGDGVRDDFLNVLEKNGIRYKLDKYYSNNTSGVVITKL